MHESRDLRKDSKHCWLNAYYPTEEEACYLAGDIYWSEEGIKKVIETETNDVVFFAAPGEQDGRKGINIKKHREPLGFKVVNQEHFRTSINALKDMIDKKIFSVDPVSWTLYKYLNNLQINYDNWNNDIFDKPGNLVRIDDITTDIDSEGDIPKLERLIRYIKIVKGEVKMVRVVAKQLFNLNEKMFKELKELTRALAENNNENVIYTGDTFLCDVHIARYLLNEEDIEGNKGNNPVNTKLVETIEVIPDLKEKVDKEAPAKIKAFKEVEEKPKRGRKKKC